MPKARTTRIRRRAERWISRRNPLQKGPITLHRRRIFILPTRGGLYFTMVVFVMLLGAMNYSNSLGFVLTFLLVGVGLVGMHHCHRNLLGLQIDASAPADVFAGEHALFRLSLRNPGRLPRYALRVHDGADLDGGLVDVAADASTTVTLFLPTTRRGPVVLPRLRIDSQFPLGLFRAWAWAHLDVAGLAYPTPRGSAPLPARSNAQQVGQAGSHAGHEDFAGLRPYQRGDPPRLIHWKAYARSGEVLTRQFHDPRQQTQWLDWRALAPQAEEMRLGQLARWIVDAEQAGIAYGLRLPNDEIQPACGAAHRQRCLRLLALFRFEHAA